MNRIVLIALLLAASMSFQSCSLWRKVFHRKDKKSTALVIGGTDNSAGKKDTSGKNYYGTDTMKTTASLSSMMPLWDRDIAYHTFSGKAKVHYDGKGDQQDFTAFIRMERGKKVWISIVALGLVEALRAQVTPDSVIAIDRIHHTVRALPASEAGKLLPAGFDFASLQRLLIGDVLHGAKKPDAVTTLSDGGWQFTLNDGDVYQNAVFSARDSTLSSQLLQTGQNASFASIRYEDYSINSGRKFSAHRIMQMRNKGELYNVEMEFSRAEFDGTIETPFSVPARYEKK